MNELLYFLLWGGVFFLLMRYGCGAHVMGHGHAKATQSDDDRTGPTEAETLRRTPPTEDIDPVCGKSVSTRTGKPSVHEGDVYYFCSTECRERFEATPEHYVDSPLEESSLYQESSHV